VVVQGFSASSRRRRAAAALTTMLALAGCGRSTPGAPAGSQMLPAAGSQGRAMDLRILRARPGATGKIQHVVFIMQENRSFDNLFAGFPGADTVSSGLNSRGQTIPLTPISMAAPYDIDHSSSAFFAACDGSPAGRNCKMDGFDQEANGANPSTFPHPQYGYVPHGESKIYFDMAQQYVVGDRMFTSHLDASFISHQYLIAGQADRAVDFPNSIWGCGAGRSNRVATLTDQRTFGPSVPACFNYRTLADEVDAKGLTWRFYIDAKNSIWSSFQAIHHIRYSKKWRKNVVLDQNLFSDIRDGFLANVTWVLPSGPNSDHSGSGSTSGPSWVASVVNAVGKSPFWNSTAIFVMWDEWGGWYDHVQPPYVDFDGLGMRVPLLVISAYAKKNHVSHVQYEHGSVLRFIEDQFGLAQLAASDTRANSPEQDCFDFTQSPRPFTPFATALKPSDLVRMDAPFRTPFEHD
jgi:phospholipase C